jgi:hypothetical protein
MRYFILILVLFFNLSASAQNFKLSSTSASLGKGSVSSGYDICLNFQNDEQEIFSVVGNHTRVTLAYTWPVSPFNLAASGGFFKNTPWLGPKVTFNPCSFITTMHWLAVSAGKPEKPEFKARLLFGFNAIYVKVGKFQLTYSLLNWLVEEPQHIPGIFFGNPIGDNWSYSVGVEYNLRDSEPLFQFAFKKTF